MQHLCVNLFTIKTLMSLYNECAEEIIAETTWLAPFITISASLQLWIAYLKPLCSVRMTLFPACFIVFSWESPTTWVIEFPIRNVEISKSSNSSACLAKSSFPLNIKIQNGLELFSIISSFSFPSLYNVYSLDWQVFCSFNILLS